MISRVKYAALSSARKKERLAAEFRARVPQLARKVAEARVALAGKRSRDRRAEAELVHLEGQLETVRFLVERLGK